MHFYVSSILYFFITVKGIYVQAVLWIHIDFNAYPDPVDKIFFFISETAIYLFQGIPQITSKLQEKPPALKREHPALQNKKL